MKKIWYLIWFTVFIIIFFAGYTFLKQSSSKNIEIMLILIGCVVLARIVITPIVAILVHRHDFLKEHKEQERKNNGK